MFTNLNSHVYVYLNVYCFIKIMDSTCTVFHMKFKNFEDGCYWISVARIVNFLYDHRNLYADFLSPRAHSEI
ncbi:hypothetical protein NY2A_b345R [Paramecium bursaria Chlorella virus NY2A]|uniref:Uncharacterized protein b345R n=1 Tax=Paramecium bursaria Chlorella virus NY2A TaxID=46021 RepID=A7IWM0_PBCVN|nr:hypothetical protein NY2A_b345R [Paramecium bursaria Chlorella virus NY2A]ABT14744.1 hypothetical protein NY2A_b345R [Paramecium bursaria Chlorella virus NY2A]